MTQYIQEIIVDIVPGITKPLPRFFVSQNDNGRLLKIKLKDYGQPFVLSGEELITLKARKANGQRYEAPVENHGGDFVIISTSSEMTDKEGDIPCALVIEDGEKVLTTSKFFIVIEHKP